MARLNRCIEEMEKAQEVHAERITSIVSPEQPSLANKDANPPKPAQVNLSQALSDFADRVCAVAKRQENITARVEL
jgi:hypothetical protein